MVGSLLSLALEWQTRKGWESAEVGNLLAAARLHHQEQDTVGSLANILYGQCLHLLARGQADAAYDVAQSLWQLNQLPNQGNWQAELHLLLGTILFDLRKPQHALAHFQRGLTVIEKSDTLFLHRILPFAMTVMLHLGAAMAADALGDDTSAHQHLAHATAYLSRDRA